MLVKWAPTGWLKRKCSNRADSGWSIPEGRVWVKLVNNYPHSYTNTACAYPDSKVHGANIEATWVLLAPWTLLSGYVFPEISCTWSSSLQCHYDVMAWKRLSYYWVFVSDTHRSSVNSQQQAYQPSRCRRFETPQHSYDVTVMEGFAFNALGS